MGSNSGQGYNINIPWNDIDHGAVSDDDYLYIYEKLLHPIISECSPELILISCGFDSAAGDPIGDLHLTNKTYSHILKRLMTLNTKIGVFLEGGYNTDNVSNGTLNVLEILLGKKEDCQTPLKEIKPQAKVWEYEKLLYKEFKVFWPSLINDGLEGFKDYVKNQTKVQNEAIVGGHQYDFRIKDDKILKRAKKNELEFYQNLFKEGNPELSDFKDFIPKYSGVELINDSKYLVLDNILHSMPHASVLDIKLGKFFAYEGFKMTPEQLQKRIEKDRGKETLSEKFNFRFTGYILKDSKGQIAEKKNKVYLEIKESQLKSTFIRLLESNGKERNEEALKFFIGFVGRLLGFLESQTKRKFFSTSILFGVDNINGKFDAKWIDFNYAVETVKSEIDEFNVDGLKNLKKLLESI